MPKDKKTGKNINTSHPMAFKKLPYRVQHSRPMDYRYVDYDYASYKCQQYGIKSARQYRAWQQSFKPAGFPSNVPRAYSAYWISWDAFLNTENTYMAFKENAVRAEELLPYKDAVHWTQSQQFQTVEEFFKAFDDGMVPKGIPRQPQVRYKEFYPKGGWKYFLGKKVESLITAKKEMEPVCALCRTVGQPDNVLTLVIASSGIYTLQKQLEAAPHIQAVKVYHWYHDFGQHVFDMLNAMGSKQSENSWMFADPGHVFYELQSVLEPYVIKV